MQEIILGEGGTRRVGVFKTLATSQAEAEATPIEPGKVYEHRIQTQFLPDWLLEPIATTILSIQDTFTEIDVLWWRVARGEVAYQFWIPPEKAGLQLVWWAWVIIGIVLAVIGIFVLKWAFGELVQVAKAVFEIALYGLGVVIVIAAAYYIWRKAKIPTPRVPKVVKPYVEKYI